MPGYSSDAPAIRFGQASAMAVTAALSTTVLLTSGFGIWSSTREVRRLAEDDAATRAASIAARLPGTEEPSAATLASVVDEVLGEQLAAFAAAAALLIEAAEEATRPSAYIRDVLAQITVRSPISRIDAIAPDGRTIHTTGAEVLGDEEIERLQAAGERSRAGTSDGTLAARNDPAGLRKSAAATTPHRPLTIGVEQLVETGTIEATWSTEPSGEEPPLASRETAGIARLIDHGVELAGEAGWSPERIAGRLALLTGTTAISRITIVGPTGRTLQHVSDDGNQQGGTDDEAWRQIAHDAIGTQSVRHLPGHEGPRLRWISGAVATRRNGHTATLVETATRTGGLTLVETAWQTEAETAARLPETNGAWVAVTPADGDAPVLGAAAAGQEDARRNGWDAWTPLHAELAAAAARDGAAGTSRGIGLDPRGDAWIIRAAAAPAAAAGGRLVTVIEMDANRAAERLRGATAMQAGGAAALLLVVVTGARAAVKRWIERPLGEITAAVVKLSDGTPPGDFTGTIRERRDEFGVLARRFEAMSTTVLARHAAFEELVAERTQSLSATTEALQESQARTQRELEIARQVQVSLVPAENIRHDSFKATCRMEPAGHLGGDFVVVQPRPDGKIVVAVCDVSGKGISAALFMAYAHGVAHGAATNHATLEAVAEGTNRELCAGNELAMFATAFICMVDPVAEELEYTYAGHEDAFVLTPNGIERLTRTGRRAAALGLDPDETFTTTKRRLQADETVIAYTDGITDACDTAGTDYGEERLLAALGNGSPDITAATMRLWDSVDDWRRGATPVDDRTVLGFGMETNQ